jgi:hypothetical protein
MPKVTLSLKRTKSEQEQACGVCGARFAPIEDSGSRVLTLKAGDAPAVIGLLCGGCYSKWSAGSTVNLDAAPLPPSAA